MAENNRIFLGGLWLSLLFILSACNSVQKLQRQEELRKKVLELAEKDLDFRLPKNGRYWAGFRSVEFVNGDELSAGERTFRYSKKDSRSWQARRHIVEAHAEVVKGKTVKAFPIRYMYRETGLWTTKVELEFIYDFPSEEYLHKEDPFKKFRQDGKLLRALRQRRAYVGMPEEALSLAFGQPLSIESKTSLHGVEKKLIYLHQAIYVKSGQVVAREHL